MSEKWRTLTSRPWVTFAFNGWGQWVLGVSIGSGYDPHVMVYLGPWYLLLSWRGWEVL